MNILRSLPVCKCDPKCSCGLIDEIRKESLSISNVDLSQANAVHHVQSATNDTVAAVSSYNALNTTSAVTLIPKFNGEEFAMGGKFSGSHINSISLNASTWILDSGATDHIICSLDYFDEYCDAHGAEDNLPTGNTVAIIHIGNVRFNKDLWLKNALHIPSFKFNIVSVSKLLQDTNSMLMFISDQCVIQGALGMKVGSAKLHNGLYLLNEPPKPIRESHSFAIHCNSTEVWHQRLGHFPINKMQFLNDIKVSHVKNSL